MNRSPARRVHALVMLASDRLRSSRGGRVARAAGVVVGVGFSIVAIASRGDDGAALLPFAASILAFAAGFPVALASATDRAAEDRAHGVEALAGARGLAPRALASARVLGAMAATARAIGVPLVAIAVVSLLAGGKPSAHALIDVVGAVAFALIAGSALGGLGAVCAGLARSRGRLVFWSLILAPWALAEATGHDGFSLPGALRALVDFTLASADRVLSPLA